MLLANNREYLPLSRKRLVQRYQIIIRQSLELHNRHIVYCNPHLITLKLWNDPLPTVLV